MALTHDIAVGSVSVQVRELSVREVREWALKVEAGLVEVDPVLHLALEDCSAEDILLMSNASKADLEGMTPSELAEIAAICRRLNPHFFRLRVAITRAAQVLSEQARQALSSEPAPS